jgi:hypothetical protein
MRTVESALHCKRAGLFVWEGIRDDGYGDGYG